MKKSKIVAMLLALLASICLWVYAVTVVNPEDTVTISGIRLEFEGTDDLEKRGLMITGGEDSTVSVKLKGTRSDLKELNNDTVVALVNLSRITEADEHDVTWTLEYPGSVASGDISIENRSSNYVTLQVSEIMEVTLDIELDYTVSTAPSYWTDKSLASLTPQTVTITGPVDEVSLIEKAEVRLEKTGLSSRAEEKLALVLLNDKGEELEIGKYWTVSTEAVDLVLPVYSSKEITLEVDFINGGGVTQDDMDCRISPAKITVTGDSAALAKISSRLTIAEIDLAEYYGDPIPQIMMSEINELLPDNVINRSSRETVDIVVDFKDTVTTKEFAISSQQVVRIDSVEELELADESVTVTVRGNVTQLANLRADEIKVYADLSRHYDEESGTVTLTIELPDGLTLGVIGGPYKMNVVEATPPNTEP